MKKISITILFFLRLSLSLQAQTEEERKFLDSLQMGGSHLLGKTLPPFALNFIRGKLVTNKNLTNKVTYINLWYESCPPCIAEVNALEELYRTFKHDKNFQFWSVTFEKHANIARISKKYKMTYPVISTTRDSLYYLNFKNGFPTSMIIDTQGKIAFFSVGGTTSPSAAHSNFRANIHPVFDSLLAQQY